MNTTVFPIGEEVWEMGVVVYSIVASSISRIVTLRSGILKAWQIIDDS